MDNILSLYNKNNIAISSRELFLLSSIPNRTRNLLWITNIDPSLVPSPKEVARINITIKPSGISMETLHQTIDPSIIFTKLPINESGSTEKLSYGPSYRELTPEQRWIYLNWLRDVSRPIEIGYVFIYYYGLERHLMIGDYNNAVDEILYLFEHHKSPSFQHYAKIAILSASLYRNHFDIFSRIPNLLQPLDELSVLIKLKMRLALTPQDIADLANLIKFNKRYYIKKHLDKFKELIVEVFPDYEEDLFSNIKINNVPKKRILTFANYSFPDNIRYPEIPDVLSIEEFKGKLNNILKTTCDKLKEQNKRR